MVIFVPVIWVDHTVLWIGRILVQGPIIEYRDAWQTLEAVL